MQYSSAVAELAWDEIPAPTRLPCALSSELGTITSKRTGAMTLSGLRRRVLIKIVGRGATAHDQSRLEMEEGSPPQVPSPTKSNR